MMTHEVELPRHWYSMTRLALICFAIGLTLVACSFVAWWLMLLPTADALRPVIAIFYDRWSLAIGLTSMGIGLSAWTRAWVAVRLVLPLLSLLMGIGLIAVTGYREVHAPASGLPQIPHAVMGVGAVVLLLFGISGSTTSFAPLVELFGVGRPTHRLATILRATSYVALTIGLLVPFTPRLFGGLTPHACELRVAATGALAFAVPFVVAAVGSLRLVGALRIAEDRVPICTHCGYRRPAGEVCPECGR